MISRDAPMPILFENTHIRTKELYKEIEFHRYFSASFSNILLLVMFPLSLISHIANKTFPIISIIILLDFALKFFLYFHFSRLKYAREHEAIEHRNIVYRYTVTEDTITLHYALNDSTYTIEWSSIKKVWLTKNYIILVSKANYLHIFQRDSFSTGNEHSFLTFLVTKGLKIK